MSNIPNPTTMESDLSNIVPHGYGSQQGELAQFSANQTSSISGGQQGEPVQFAANKAPVESSAQGGQEGASHSTATMLKLIASGLETLDAQCKLIETNLPSSAYRFLVDRYNNWVSRARVVFIKALWLVPGKRSS